MNAIEWRDVPELGGAYSVSTDGRVRSNPHVIVKRNGAKQTVYGRELKPGRCSDGYLTVKIRGKSEYVHRLVANTFLYRPNNEYEVNHKDENKQNNHVSNLEWVTHQQNCDHGTRNERCGDPACPVVARGGDGAVLRFASMSEAERAGYARAGIRQCCDGKWKAYRGLTWERETKVKNYG